ncbi:MAG: hypothetical protein CL862_08665 [Cyanobium sp. NAT70]|nr:hypothetical protein [Cyanobium sp. NAT70]|tara:strand:+ start:5767 stop:5985 length:219 start_codon:yes stop_codon:yes gene_type:complete
MSKLALMAWVWGIALMLSCALHFLGQIRPQPLQAPWMVVLLIVFAPPVLLGGWLMLNPSIESRDGGTRESVD